MSTFILSLLYRNLTSTDEVRPAWSIPDSVLPVLLLLGGDIVQASLAQLAGGLFTPAVFSFGWVAYTFTALVSVIRGDRLMPTSPDSQCLVINGESGLAMSNRSWIISRILKDFDSWKDPNVNVKEENLLEILRQRYITSGREPRVSLSVSFYNVSGRKKAGVGDYDWIWFSSFAVIAVQFAVAAFPYALYDDSSILVATTVGTTLAGITGALPQWHKEKVDACRKGSEKTFVITGGNGTKNVIIIRSRGFGLDLQDLASPDVRTAWGTKFILCVLSILWILLLVLVSSLKQNTWFLLVVGGLGMLENILVAGLPRKPGAYGIHLEYEKTIVERKVMATLMAVEETQPSLGRSLLAIYFPTGLTEDEVTWWAKSSERVRVAKDHPVVTASLESLGYQFESRYRRTEEMEDIEGSFQGTRQAIEVMPDNLPSLAKSPNSSEAQGSRRYKSLLGFFERVGKVVLKTSSKSIKDAVSVFKRSLRPKIPEGLTRIEWICSCGDDLYGDFKEATPGSLIELAARLGGTIVNGDTFTGSSTQHASGSHADDIERKTKKKYLEICVRSSKTTHVLGEKDTSSIKTDRDMFKLIKTEYHRLRLSSQIFGFALQEPNGGYFVKFRVDKSVSDGHTSTASVAIMSRPSIPPLEEVNKSYTYEPTPMDEPPMPPNTFIHYFNNDTAAHGELLWSKRFPEKLGNSLVCSPNKLEEGWGIEIGEGPNFVLFCTGMVLALLISGVVAGLYAYYMKDTTTGVAIGAWLTATQSMVAAALFFRWT